MLKSTLLLIFLSFCIGTGVWLFFIYAVKKGEFDDIEAAKYRMLEDDDDLPESQKRRHPAEPSQGEVLKGSDHAVSEKSSSAAENR